MGGAMVAGPEAPSLRIGRRSSASTRPPCAGSTLAGVVSSLLRSDAGCCAAGVTSGALLSGSSIARGATPCSSQFRAENPNRAYNCLSLMPLLPV